MFTLSYDNFFRKSENPRKPDFTALSRGFLACGWWDLKTHTSLQTPHYYALLCLRVTICDNFFTILCTWTASS